MVWAIEAKEAFGGLVIYLIGGAARSGKSTLCQLFASQKGFGWISTDLIKEILHEAGVKKADHWDASPNSIAESSDRFLPYLERFIWGVRSMTEGYVLEGVDFLPAQVAALEKRFELRAIFLGRSEMTLEQVDQFSGKSPGYAELPEIVRMQIASDVPTWSTWIKNEASASGYPYVDVAKGDFASRLEEGLAILGA